jgi:hypothetical protein
MTPEAQRIAIAEVCGWKNCRCDEGTVNMPPKGEPDDDFNRDVVEHKKCIPYCGFPREPHRETLPDYLKDLNSMNEAEKVMQCGHFQQYSIELWHVCTLAHPDSQYNELTYDRLHATAAQRAEAFLRTLNLWKD